MASLPDRPREKFFLIGIPGGSAVTAAGTVNTLSILFNRTTVFIFQISRIVYYITFLRKYPSPRRLFLHFFAFFCKTLPKNHRLFF